MTLLLWAPACAKQEPPPGHRPDARPPAVSEISPAPGSVVEDLGGALIIRFDEPISDPRGLERELEASPAHRYRVTTSHTAIRIRPEGGWRAVAVYRFVVPGDVSDILGNRREEPIEVTFSTGPPIPSTVVAGRVWDRITGRGVRGARTLFVAADADSVPYTAVSDTGGVFRLPSVPPGRYHAFGFMDRNRNLRPDRRLESHDSTSFTLEDSTSSVSLDLVLLEPDSTPPVLGLLETPDSARIRLVFDDYLVPDQKVELDQVSLAEATSGSPWPIRRAVVLTGPEAESRGPGSRDTVRAGDRRSPVEPLPSQVLELRLERPLERGSYRVRVREVLNLHRIAGSADTTFVHPLPGSEEESRRRRGVGGGGG